MEKPEEQKKPKDRRITVDHNDRKRGANIKDYRRIDQKTVKTFMEPVKITKAVT